MSIQQDTAPSTDSTVQETFEGTPIRNDVVELLSGNRELASLAYREEPFYDTRIQTALKNDFGWDIRTSEIREVVETIDKSDLRKFARPDPRRTV